MMQKEKFSKLIGENIKRERVKKGMTQDELAHECGFYRTYINLLETNKRMPSSFTLYRISVGLSVEIDSLFPKK